jgi:two-component system, cell cycle sensor histidine kinase and response regulator CckA
MRIHAKPDLLLTFKITVKMLKENPTILIADDDETIRQLLKTLLSKYYHVIVARDGLECLAEFHQNKHRIDVVVLDLNMPRMLGKDVVRAMQQERRHVPIVVLCGAMSAEQRLYFMKEGVTSMLQKPVDISLILKAVQSAIYAAEISASAAA